MRVFVNYCYYRGLYSLFLLHVHWCYTTATAAADKQKKKAMAHGAPLTAILIFLSAESAARVAI